MAIAMILERFRVRGRRVSVEIKRRAIARLYTSM